MQSTLTENIGIQVQSPVTNLGLKQDEGESTTPLESVKKKRKRNRKKNKANQLEEKVENLISKTFQAKIQAESLNKVHQKVDSTMSSVQNKNTLVSPSKKSQQSAKKIDSPKKSPATVINSLEKVNSTESKSGLSVGKSREEILADREAKKLAKQASKNKTSSTTIPVVAAVENKAETPIVNAVAQHPLTTKTREEILADREAKKLKKQLAKKLEYEIRNKSKNIENLENSIETLSISVENPNEKDVTKIPIIPEKKVLSKAERRAIQEEQRAAKAKLSADKQPAQKPTKQIEESAKKATSSPTTTMKKLEKTLNNLNDCKVKLFSHLDGNFKEKNLFINHQHIHPTIVRLGEQYAKKTIVGSNARCIAFLNALKTVVQDFETPPKKEFSRSLEASIKNCVEHLSQCRPLAVSISNAHKCIKLVLTQLPTDQPESELKEIICEFIETYIKDQIEKAALAISSSVQEKISNGDVILTFGCSSLINHILEEAHSRKIDFRVIVVDSRPFTEGQELLRRLVSKEIPCTYVLINAIGFIMSEVTKVLLGAHSLLANGYVMARTGTAQVALVARSYNVPVLVCCETHKFSERVQTDAIVYNELGNPDDLVINKDCKLSNWRNLSSKISPLNLNFDITPPELVTAVVTEVAILPCTSVPVILRLRPTEIGC